MYKMLMNCGFTFIKSEKLRTKMFHDAKKIQKNTPPRIYFFITFATRKCELSFKWLIFIITYFYDIDETKNRKLNSLIDGETIDFSYSVTFICIAS